VVPRVGPVDGRTNTLDLHGRVGGDSLLFRGSGTLDSTTSRATRTADTDVGLSYDVPFSLGATRVTVGGSRTLSIRESRTPADSIGEEWSAIGRALGDASTWYSAMPGYELFDPGLPASFAAATTGLSDATYTPAVSLGVTRSISSAPISLVLPTTMTIELSRPNTRSLDTVTSRHELSTRLTYVAPNLFGSLGVHPLFGWYDTDEYVTNFSVRTTVESGVWRTELDVDQQSRFLWRDGRNVTVRTTAATAFGDATTGDVTAEGIYHWESPADRLFEWKPLSRFADSGALFRHDESVVITAGFDSTDANGAWSRYTGRLRHDSALALPGSGEIRLYGGIGLGVERDSGFSLFLLGGELGIEVDLRL
jgi:hypothetical protein